MILCSDDGKTRKRYQRTLFLKDLLLLLLSILLSNAAYWLEIF